MIGAYQRRFCLKKRTNNQKGVGTKLSETASGGKELKSKINFLVAANYVFQKKMFFKTFFSIKFCLEGRVRYVYGMLEKHKAWK